MTDLTELLTKGIEYPTVTETVYTDQKSLYLLGEETDHEKKVELKEKVLESGITFQLRGLPRSVVNAIVRKAQATVKDEDDRIDQVNLELLSRSITGAVDSKGSKVEITEDSLKEFLDALPQPSFSKMINALNALEFDSLRNEDELTDPTLS